MACFRLWWPTIQWMASHAAMLSSNMSTSGTCTVSKTGLPCCRIACSDGTVKKSDSSSLIIESIICECALCYCGLRSCQSWKLIPLNHIDHENHLLHSATLQRWALLLHAAHLVGHHCVQIPLSYIFILNVWALRPKEDWCVVGGCDAKCTWTSRCTSCRSLFLFMHFYFTALHGFGTCFLILGSEFVHYVVFQRGYLSFWKLGVSIFKVKK